MKTIKIKENQDIPEDYSIADWKESPHYILNTIDNLLKPFKLQIQLLNAEDDSFYFKIVKTKEKEHKHKWNYAGMCEGEEKPKCGKKTYICKCGAYKDCDGGIID